MVLTIGSLPLGGFEVYEYGSRNYNNNNKLLLLLKKIIKLSTEVEGNQWFGTTNARSDSYILESTPKCASL